MAGYGRREAVPQYGFQVFSAHSAAVLRGLCGLGFCRLGKRQRPKSRRSQRTAAECAEEKANAAEAVASPIVCFLLCNGRGLLVLQSLVQIVSILGLQKLMHNPANRLDHSGRRVRLKNIPAHIYPGGALADGTIRHM